MPLPGDRLGPYEIVAPLDAGGMGEIFRARDTRLPRQVAIKLLTADRVADHKAQARLGAEAAAVARLTHPKICSLYDIGVSDGRTFLVMELLSGSTLAARLRRGDADRGLPLPEALTIAADVAEALAYAHRHGVVHRDVKPSNIMLTEGGTKLLDFGIACLRGDAAADATTVTQTLAGNVVGTLPYMAPEQLDGRSDERTDVYALGAVLHEMLAGARAFPGSSVHELMASITRVERPRLPGAFSRTYPALTRAVEKCLAIDPTHRWQSMADLADELRWLHGAAPQHEISNPAGPRPAGLPAWLAAVAVVVAAALGTLGGTRLQPATRPPLPAVSHLFFSLAPGDTFGSEGLGPELAVSHDGSRIAYVAGGATRQLFLRTLESGTSEPLPKTEDARAPFFSPDGASVGYFAHGQLWRMRLPNGTPQAVCACGSGEAEWGADDVIRFATYAVNGPILSVPASGGVPTPVTAVPPGEGHFAPQFLPETGALLFSARRLGSNGVSFAVLLQPAGSVEATRVMDGAQRARVLGDGTLLYQVDSQVLRANFDVRRATLVGSPSLVLGDVPSGDFNVAAWATSPDVLVYRSGSARQRRMVWVSRDGTSVPLEAPLRAYSTPRLSPDGRRVAVEISAGANFDVYLYDLERGALTPLTVDHLSRYPQWTPDGRFVTVSRRKADGHDIYWRESEGSGDFRELLRGGSGGTYAESWSPDGRWFVFWENASQADVWTMDMRNRGQRRPLVQTADEELGGRLSPDGRWLAYMSSRSGRPELFVKRFEEPGLGQQLSTDGAQEVVWARDGREIYFRHNTQLLVVSVEPGDVLRVQKPRVLFDKPFYRYGGQALVHYDVAADGRFLMLEELNVSRQEIGVIQGLSQIESAPRPASR